MSLLEKWRLHSDLIEVYKILNEFEAIDRSLFFSASENNLRGHGLKLFKHRFCTSIGKFAFSNRVIDEWNKLPGDVVSCNSVFNFKIQLDHYFKNGGRFI